MASASGLGILFSKLFHLHHNLWGASYYNFHVTNKKLCQKGEGNFWRVHSERDKEAGERGTNRSSFPKTEGIPPDVGLPVLKLGISWVKSDELTNVTGRPVLSELLWLRTAYSLRCFLETAWELSLLKQARQIMFFQGEVGIKMLPRRTGESSGQANLYLYFMLFILKNNWYRKTGRQAIKLEIY